MLSCFLGYYHKKQNKTLVTEQLFSQRVSSSFVGVEFLLLWPGQGETSTGLCCLFHDDVLDRLEILEFVFKTCPGQGQWHGDLPPAPVFPCGPATWLLSGY